MSCNYISREKNDILQPLDSIYVVRLYQSVIMFFCGTEK